MSVSEMCEEMRVCDGVSVGQQMAKTSVANVLCVFQHEY